MLTDVSKGYVHDNKMDTYLVSSIGNKKYRFN